MGTILSFGWWSSGTERRDSGKYVIAHRLIQVMTSKGRRHVFLTVEGKGKAGDTLPWIKTPSPRTFKWSVEVFRPRGQKVLKSWRGTAKTWGAAKTVATRKAKQVVNSL